MSTFEGVLIILAIDVIGLPALYVQNRRAMRHESERDRIIRAAHQQAETARLLDPITLAEPDPLTRHYLERIEAGDAQLLSRLDRLRHELTHREEER